MEYDVVNKPRHYNQGGIECIDALKAATVSKTGIEDVKKARWYIDRLIKELEEKK